MYIETSAPRKQGDKALLLSPTLTPTTGSKCFSFWYHMYGRNIGSLTITARKIGDKSGTLAWSKTIQQGNRWNRGEATIPAENKNYQVSRALVI